MTAPAHAIDPALDVAAYLERERARVDAALESLAPSLVRGFAPALRDAVLYAVHTPGKRLRPILCIAAYRLARGEDEAPEAAYRLACALELVHTYSLVHDDLPCMDDDDLRRGRPTVHVVHGYGPALLAGAALIPAAARALDQAAADLGADAATRARLVGELCRAGGALGMVGGQLLDLEGEERAVDAAGLEEIHRRKTGALLTSSLRIGAIAAGADAGVLAALTAYGEELGLAFQIVDDVLDEIGDAAALGKTAGKDRSSGKATYPSLFGLAGAREMAEERGTRAVGALRRAGLHSAELEGIAAYVLERER